MVEGIIYSLIKFKVYLKSIYVKLITLLSASSAFILSYFMDITAGNAEQFLALICVVFLDGIFGILAGVKREGFITHKAIKVLKTAVAWCFILGVILMAESAFGVSWLSETIIVPFIILQILSALKNASMAGYISAEFVNELLDTIDRHKGKRIGKKNKKL